MSSEDLAVLAEALVAHRTDKQYMADAAWGIPCESHAAVHAIHRAMIEKPGDLGEHAGWKVGTTNATAWTSFELVEPMRAPLFANTIVKAPATFSRKDDNLTMLEAEYCFSLKAPLSGTWAKPVTAEEAWEAGAPATPTLTYLPTQPCTQTNCSCSGGDEEGKESDTALLGVWLHRSPIVVQWTRSSSRSRSAALASRCPTPSRPPRRTRRSRTRE